MSPAQQRFCTRDPPPIDLDLVEEFKLTERQRLTQVVDQSGTCLQLHLRGGIEETQGITSGRFGLIHGGIGVFEQIIHADTLTAEQADADAG